MMATSTPPPFPPPPFPPPPRLAPAAIRVFGIMALVVVVGFFVANCSRFVDAFRMGGEAVNDPDAALERRLKQIEEEKRGRGGE
jgi:hypothetical protein